MGRVDGEIALVTGATSGLGRAVAAQLAAEGAQVVLAGRDPTRGTEVERRIREAGGDATFIQVELSQEASCVDLVAGVTERYGGITVLVNNAVSPEAISRDAPVGEADVSVWTTQFNVNLLAPAVLCREAIPHMLAAAHGSIVNVSSRAAERGTPRLAAYTATKGGLNALARSITIDYARHGIRCNTVQPGYVRNAEREVRDGAPSMERYEAMHLTRLPTDRDVANAVLFFASSESEVISGVTLPVDGGSTAVRGATLG